MSDQVVAESGTARSTENRRGTTTIARRVFEKVAAQVAGEVSAAGGTSGGFLGIGTRRDLDAKPEVDVTLTGDGAVVSVRCGVRYPASLRATTDEVRQNVTTRLQELTGVNVDRVDIQVAWLSRTQSPGPRPR
ncbi:Asp23/Gls24 family envelope stress response protein [Naumannella halotolerans]|uniref:Putative alkaline shock family protein YloU n=1 Tax=Naumannella halotolerans TaxID=993414 RepID=A0A4R7J8Y4_9ACTN|nr:Asp23/Gls24 family envelope stress response protein [Naumannella halotolerans]TDT33775.1 putative alkaline shock family protein YloU [Naumannella halotolerans]